jgi:hypothetical protein
MNIGRHLRYSDPADPYWANVSLLLRADGVNGATYGSVTDVSPLAATLTRFGSSSGVAKGPFSTTGSIFCAGGGNLSHFTVPHNAAFNFGTTDFTLETFFWPMFSQGNSGFFGKRVGDSNYSPFLFGLTGSALYLLASSSGGNWEINSSGGTCNYGAWNHGALVRSGSVINGWLNGTRVINVGAINPMNNTSAIALGDYHTNGAQYCFPGYLSNMRIVSGAAVYTPGATITVPTAPLTAVAGTALLVNAAPAITDETGKFPLATVGAAQLSTTIKKFGSSSLWLNGTTDYVRGFTSADLTFPGDFTVEAWVYLTAPGSYHNLLEGRSGAAFQNYTFGIWNNAGAVRLDAVNASTRLTGSTTSVAQNVWTHVAWARSGGTLMCFVDGVKDATTLSYGTSMAPASTAFYIGAIVDPQFFAGYIDDLRITKGVARYTANFTPPTSRFPNH